MPALVSSEATIPPAHPMPTTTTGTLGNFVAIFVHPFVNDSYGCSSLEDLISQIALFGFPVYTSYASPGIFAWPSPPCFCFRRKPGRHKRLQLSLNAVS